MTEIYDTRHYGLNLNDQKKLINFLGFSFCSRSRDRIEINGNSISEVAEVAEEGSPREMARDRQQES
jgi:hypothetical protein